MNISTSSKSVVSRYSSSLLNVLSKYFQLQEALDRSDDHERHVAFWESMKDWFIAHGYTPYKRIYEDGWPTHRCTPTDPNSRKTFGFPYAYHSNHHRHSPPNVFFTGKSRTIVCSQDAQGRHVVMKLVKHDTEEFRINQYLFDLWKNTPLDFDLFNHIIPVLDMIPLEDHWFIVMPRWGISTSLPTFSTVKELLHFIHCLLKGLKYLHDRNIFHGDISANNILANEFSSDIDPRDRMRRDLRSQGLLTYAIFDFNYSIRFPPDYTREECRLPYTQSWQGTPGFSPPDTSAGEFDFDPFAWDVACLGIVFCGCLQQYTPAIPMLAPLLDKMVTWDIPQRFTASEALTFFEKMRSEMTEYQLYRHLHDFDEFSGVFWEECDRWKDLDAAFIQKWSHYRTPPIPWTKRIMKTICGGRLWVLHTVAFVRRLGDAIWQMITFTSNFTFMGMSRCTAFCLLGSTLKL